MWNVIPILFLWIDGYIVSPPLGVHGAQWICLTGFTPLPGGYHPFRGWVVMLEHMVNHTESVACDLME